MFNSAQILRIRWAPVIHVPIRLFNQWNVVFAVFIACAPTVVCSLYNTTGRCLLFVVSVQVEVSLFVCSFHTHSYIYSHSTSSSSYNLLIQCLVADLHIVTFSLIRSLLFSVINEPWSVSAQRSLGSRELYISWVMTFMYIWCTFHDYQSDLC